MCFKYRSWFLSVILILSLLFINSLYAQDVRVVADLKGGIKTAVIEVWDSYPNGRILQEIYTDNNGVFTLPDLPSGSDLRIHADWYFPLVSFSSQVPDTSFLEPVPVVEGSMQYLEYCSTESFFHGYPVQVGDVVYAVDPDGVICGVTNVKYWESDTTNGFLIAVFGDVANTNEIDEGALDGDTIRFFINKESAIIRKGAPVWHSGGSRRIELNLPGFLNLSTEVLPDPSYGKIVVTPDTNRIPYGVNVSLRAVPNFGYKFINWVNAALDTTRNISFTITSDTLVRAYFSKLSALPLHIAMLSPGADYKNVPVNIPVAFKVKDELFGVNPSSINMKVNGKTVLYNGESQIDNQVFVQPVDSGYQVKYIPGNNFNSNSQIQVTIDAASRRAKNPKQIHETYEFTTGTALISDVSFFKFQNSTEIIKQDAHIGILFTGSSDGPDSVEIGDVVNLPPIPDSLRAGLFPLFFGPFGFLFDSNFTLLFHYSDALLQACGVHSPDALSILYYLPEPGSWKIVQPYDIDRPGKIVKYMADRFSYVQLVSVKPQIERTQSAGKDMIYNFPNPFNPEISSTFIRYQVHVNSTIRVEIKDISGNVVRVLERGKNCIADVTYQCEWDGRDNSGNFTANNVYFCVVTGPEIKTLVRKIAVIR